MFGSSLPSVACLKAYVLFTLCCSLVVSNSNCVVFFVVLLQVSLDCPSLIAPSVFCNVLFALEAFSFDITHVYIFLTFDFIGINIHRTFSLYVAYASARVVVLIESLVSVACTSFQLKTYKLTQNLVIVKENSKQLKLPFVHRCM